MNPTLLVMKPIFFLQTSAILKWKLQWIRAHLSSAVVGFFWRMCVVEAAVLTARNDSGVGISLVRPYPSCYQWCCSCAYAAMVADIFCSHWVVTVWLVIVAEVSSAKECRRSHETTWRRSLKVQRHHFMSIEQPETTLAMEVPLMASVGGSFQVFRRGGRRRRWQFRGPWAGKGGDAFVTHSHHGCVIRLSGNWARDLRQDLWSATRVRLTVGEDWERIVVCEVEDRER